MITQLESQDLEDQKLDQTLQQLLRRRSVDFLLIIVLNFRDLLPSVSLYWAMYHKVRQVSQSSAVIQVRNC